MAGRVVAMAVSPTPNLDGTFPTLKLLDTGQIQPENGAGLPDKSSFDTCSTPNWASVRFQAFGPYGDTPTQGIDDGAIGIDIKVFNWNDPGHPLGYVLDRWGYTHPFGATTPILTMTQTWGKSSSTGGLGSDEARALSLKPDGTGGYVLRKNGLLYRFGNVSVPMAVNPLAYAVDVELDYVSGSLIHGYVLGLDGQLNACSTNGGDAFLLLPKGGVYFGGIPFARKLVFDFPNHIGYTLDGEGNVWENGIASNYPNVGDEHRLTAAPRYPGGDVYTDLAWPATSSLAFVSLVYTGFTTTWNEFVKPTVTITAPPTPNLTDRQHLLVSLTYGPSTVAALSQVWIYVYPLAVTQAPGFKDGQGIGVVPGLSHPKSAITGIDGTAPNNVYSVQFGSDLADASDYVVCVKVKTIDGKSSGWVRRGFHTAFARPAAPTITPTELPNAIPPQTSLAIGGGLSAGQVWRVEFSDDGGTNWFSVFGGEAATVSPVLDRWAPIGVDRKYRAFRITQSPYLESLPSAVVTVNLDPPTAGVDAMLVPLNGDAPIVLDAAEWRKSMAGPEDTVEVPAGETDGVAQTTGWKGYEGVLMVHCWSKASHDALEAELKKRRPVLLRTTHEFVGCVVIQRADFEWQTLAPSAGDPWAAGFAYDVALSVRTVKPPALVG